MGLLLHLQALCGHVTRIANGIVTRNNVSNNCDQDMAGDNTQLLSDEMRRSMGETGHSTSGVHSTWIEQIGKAHVQRHCDPQDRIDRRVRFAPVCTENLI
jgi:hypothetical protein